MLNQKRIKGFIVCILLVFALLYSVQLMAEEKTGTIIGKIKIDEKGNATILPSTSDETAKVKVLTNNEPIKQSGDNGKDLNILQSQEPIKASNSDDNKAIMEYQTLLSRQKSPLKTTDEELYNIDGTIWQRKYGEYEFFLAPSVENIGEYKARISKYDNKEKGINKSISQFIKIRVDDYSRSILHTVNIDVPLYIPNHSFINVLLPIIDIEQLEDSNCYIEILKNYGKKIGILEESPSSKETIWSEGWEGSLSPYMRGDNNTSSGLDYWGDVSCEHHSGSWSLWCADEGDQPNCTNYDDNMDAYVLKTTGVNVSGYSNVQFKFWVKYNTEPTHDILYRFYSSNGSSWTQSSTSYNGNSNGWIQQTVTLNNFSTYYWDFNFFTDSSVHNYEGAYLDDMEITGSSSSLPNLTADPYNCNLQINANIVSAEVRVINNGNATAGSSYLGYYLSDDTIINTDDWYWGEDYVSSLSPGSYSDENQNFNVNSPPAGCPPGTYYFAFIVDHEDDVPESDETDNAWYFPSPIIDFLQPNLTADPSNCNLQQNLNIVSAEVRVINNGNATAGSSHLGYYLSEDTVILISDHYWGNDPVSSLSPGSYSDENQNFNVNSPPTGCSPGTYYFGIIVDYQDEVTESDETDNAWYFPSPQIVIEDPAYLTISPTSHSSPSGGDTFPISVSSNVSWTVSDNATWITFTPPSGSNNGTINVTVTANTGSTTRTGTVTVTGSGITRTCTITQPPPPYLTISPTSHSSPYTGDSFTITVSSNVSWTVSDNQSWISHNPNNGNNNGSVNVTVDPNPNTTTRSGTVTIQGSGITRTCTVNQGPYPDPYLTISPTSHSSPSGGDTFPISVSSNVSWTVSDNATWITFTPPSGSNNGTINVTVTANTGSTTRTGIVTASGGGLTASCTITQVPPYYLTFSPTTHSSPSGGDTFPISVSSNVSWTVSDNATWITFTPPSGSNNGTINVTVTANTGSTTRTGIVTASGGGLTASCTITQVPPYYLTISPTSLNFPCQGGSLPFSVSSNVTWNVTDNATWISCSPTSGSNNGTVLVSVPANTGSSSRTGTVTVQSSDIIETCLITQDPCPNMTLSLPTDATGAPGSSVSIPLTLDNPDGVGIEGIDATITFDSSVLTATGGNLAGTVLDGMNYGSQFNPSSGQLQIVIYANASLYSGSGIVAYLNFTVDPSAQDGETTDLVFTQHDVNEISVNYSNGLFTVVIGYDINGTVEYFSNSTGVPNTTVQLTGDATHTTTTASNGDYSFTEIDVGNYTSACSKSDDLGGLSGMDASRAARFAAGLITLDCYEMIAADVTMDGTISGMDASRIARYAAGLIDCLNNECIHWVFVNPPCNSSNWPPIVYESTYVYNPLDEDKYDQDFTAVRLGDVTGNWTPDSPKNDIHGSVTPIQMIDNSSLQLPIAINNSNSIEGIDIVMEYNPNVLRPINVTLNTTLENYNYTIESLFKDGTGNIIIYAQEQPANYSDVVATVNFEVIGSSNEQVDLLISTLEVNESQNNGGFVVNNGETITRALKINQDQQYNSQELICSISPNPCTSHTTINYSLQQDAFVKILLYNTRGQLIETLHDNFENAGENQLTLNTDKLKNGIYFCRIIADNQTKNVKLLIMK